MNYCREHKREFYGMYCPTCHSNFINNVKCCLCGASGDCVRVGLNYMCPSHAKKHKSDQ